MGGCCPDKDDESIGKKLGWFCLYIVVGIGMFMLTSWLLPKIEEARRLPTPRIRVSPPQYHESYPLNRYDLDRG